MSTPSEHAARKRANELYWSTDQPVRAIAEEVGMSRSAVYAAIEPLGAGVTSPDADSELVFTTRTKRDERRATCPTTGKEHDLDELPPTARRPAARADQGERARPAAPSRVRPSVPPMDPEKLLFGASIAAVGIGIGFLLASLFSDE